MHVTFGTTGYITSLLEWLEEVGLALHLPGMIYNSPLAMWIKLKAPERRKKSNDRNLFCMSSEMDNLANDGGEAVIRSGQFWEVEGGLFEIISIKEEAIEGRRWDGPGKKQIVGANVSLRQEDRHGGVGTWSIPIDSLKQSTRMALVEPTPLKLTRITKKITKLVFGRSMTKPEKSSKRKSSNKNFFKQFPGR
jgi:hypothetical protein